MLKQNILEEVNIHNKPVSTMSPNIMPRHNTESKLKYLKLALSVKILPSFLPFLFLLFCSVSYYY